jgi:mannose-6-phosphate isomerase-like protein (cupin superfamily)
MAELKIIRAGEAETVPMKGGRGSQLRFVNTDIGATALDVHLNRLDAKEPGGSYHHHSKADNVYIVKTGEGKLVVEGETYTIREDDVIYIPAGAKHSLRNVSDAPFEIYEIYAPAGEAFDFVKDD